MEKKILLYYKYVSVPNPEEIRSWQHELCSSLNLEGRIIIASEGINGTLAGFSEQTQGYIDAMNAHPLFGDIDFKETVVPAEHNYFNRLRVVVKEEVVNLGVNPQELSATECATHLTPEETHELLKNKPDDLIILDGRNYYEARVGKFEGAITPKVHHFRDFPAYIDQNIEIFRDKQVLMYCTGGIRCERASALLEKKGVAKKVYQILGGIHRYAEKFPDGFFRGKNYVFDSRVTVNVNDDIIGTCDLCTTPCDEYRNCSNAFCNKQFIGCDQCIEQLAHACSQTCFQLLQENKTPERPLRPRVRI